MSGAFRRVRGPAYLRKWVKCALTRGDLRKRVGGRLKGKKGEEEKRGGRGRAQKRGF